MILTKIQVMSIGMILIIFSCSSEKSFDSQKENYKLNREKFHELKSRLESSTGDDVMVRVSLNENYKDQFSFSIGKYDSLNNRMKFPLKVLDNVDFSHKDLDNVLSIINWKKSDLRYIITGLKEIDCISAISSNKHDSLSGTTFIYGSGHNGESYSYIFFSTDQIESVARFYEGEQDISFYNDSVIFETTW